MLPLARLPSLANGEPYVVRRPAITTLPASPGGGVSMRWPGPVLRSLGVVPSTTTWVRPIAGMSISATGLPSTGVNRGASTDVVVIVCWNWLRSEACAFCSVSGVIASSYATKSAAKAPTPRVTRPARRPTRALRDSVAAGGGAVGVVFGAGVDAPPAAAGGEATVARSFIGHLP